MVSRDPSIPPEVSITICKPYYRIHRAATVTLDTSTRAVLNVTVDQENKLESVPHHQITTRAAEQVDPIFNGSTFNGFALDWFHLPWAWDQNDIVGARKVAIRTALLSTINSQGVAFMDGGGDPYENDMYTNITRKVYARYMAHVARQVYFRPPDFDTVQGRARLVSRDTNSTALAPKPTDVRLHTIYLKLFVNDTMAFAATIVLSICSICVAFTAYAIWRRRDTILPESNEGAISVNAVAARDAIGAIMDQNGPSRRYKLETDLDAGADTVSHFPMKIVVVQDPAGTVQNPAGIV